ncbi:MAG: type II toxin-antitoxin system VapC family toxin [bacterium]|nr:type II toxin-antitoxin system VapC family toxin [bacterium]
MPDKVPRVYADANVLLAYVANEANRADTVQSILEDARQARVELLTSVLSITEVAYVQTDSGVDISLASDAAIDELWTPTSPVALVDISETVAREARRVIRRAKQASVGGIRSADAIHLASAKLHRCDRFFTYENEATRQCWNTLIEARVTAPFTDSPQLDFNN